ncbi:MAG: 30S ribosomal protein S19 [Candidatus Pacearchaeota archaeon]
MAEEIVEKKKELTFRGKSIEELKGLDIREFAKYVPSRERRTILRNTDYIENFLAKCRKKLEKNKPIKTHNRDIVIVPQMVGMTINVHNGRVFERVIITFEMLGHRLGEFTLTRVPVKHGAAGIGATRSSASRSVK